LIAERIVMSTTLDPYLSLRALSSYCGLSVRKLRDYIDLGPQDALPCYRVGAGGKIWSAGHSYREVRQLHGD